MDNYKKDGKMDYEGLFKDYVSKAAHYFGAQAPKYEMKGDYQTLGNLLTTQLDNSVGLMQDYFTGKGRKMTLPKSTVDKYFALLGEYAKDASSNTSDIPALNVVRSAEGLKRAVESSKCLEEIVASVTSVTTAALPKSE